MAIIQYPDFLRKLDLYSKLMRLFSPTGYLLCFFPAAYGLALAGKGDINIKLSILFFIGGVLARSAGCIINDYFDRNFDGKVARTKERVLASKEVSVKEALVLVIVLLSGCLLILFSLNKIAIYIGIVAFFLIILYPLTKRFTNFAQVFLGATFNLGALIGYAAIKGEIDAPAGILYISTIFWTLAYDTIYAFMDIKDDKKIGLKSTAIFFENKNYKLWLSIFYTVFIILFLIAACQADLGSLFHIYYFSYIILAVVLIYYIIVTLNISSAKNLLIRFKLNNYIGILLLVYLLHY